ncbi:MAG: tetratricopeptide repeat protein [Candidatus Acidiferrales bacterium]
MSPLLLEPGTSLSSRYEILEILGEGGMGAVYKARDRELDRLVALKVIRPELAQNPEILQRFKQELILARKVTHKNVNRIFDLGEANGTKFLTMEYVEGQDLKRLVRQRGKYPPEEAAQVVRQVCRALAAAHQEGVVHRDLKPHNIMVDNQGRVQVMDFGLASSTEATGFTQTGALLGTPEYMSPEQAKGEKADLRSDLFALGIIFYELLTGQTPYKADTVYGTLLKRTREQSVPASKLDPTIPPYINSVVMKCLQIDPALRYQSALEILKDLEARRAPSQPHRLVQAVATLRTIARAHRRATVAVMAALAVVVAAAIFLSVRSSWRRPAGVGGPVISLAILPFQNGSDDPNLDWLGPGLADMLEAEVGQSESLRSVPSDRLHQVLKDLRLSSASSQDPDTLRRVAEFSNADVLVWGKYLKLGNQIRIDANLQDLKRGQMVALKAEALGESDLLQAVNTLAKSIRDNLALSAEARNKLTSTAFRPSTASLEALRAYNEGLALGREGKYLEAVKKFEASIQADSQFALAHAKLAQTYSALGYGDEAQRYARQARDLSETLPPQERDLIQAQYARTVNDLDKAIEAYQHLAQARPSDTEILFELAGLYEAKGSMDKAREYYARVLAADPKHLEAMFAAARAEHQSRNYQASLDLLNRALSLAIQVDNQEAKARILHSIGINYKRLQKFEEALRYYRDSLTLKEQLDDKGGMAATLDEMAQVYDLVGKTDLAKENYFKAINIERAIGNNKGLADSLLNLGDFYNTRGQYDQALESAKQALQLYTELGDEKQQALCASNIGVYYVAKGQLSDALTYYQRALQLREKWNVPGEMAETLYNLADAYAQTARYDEALNYYLRALELWRSDGNKEGTAVASNGMGILFAYQGRFGAAVSAQADALKTMRELQQRSFWLGEILAAYGNALSLAGRSQQAEKTLQEALSLARELRNDAQVAKVLNYQGDLAFYQGNFSAAHRLYNEALQAASGTEDRQVALLSKINLAKVALHEGSSQTALSSLKALSREAASLGLKYLSAECSLYSGEALLEAKNYPQAERELEDALRTSENLGLRAHQARTHFVLGKVLTLTGRPTDATRHAQKARQLLQEMQKEVGGDTLLQRQDLKAIFSETASLAQKQSP